MERIYSASELANRRREVIADARADHAQIRDTDGTSLVMLAESRFNFLQAMPESVRRLVQLELALNRPYAERRSTDFGDLAWLAAFDDGDQHTFRLELLEALNLAVANNELAPVATCIGDWRRTARALMNDRGRGVLTSAGDDAFDEVRRPG
jgi:hypothetical protein